MTRILAYILIFVMIMTSPLWSPIVLIMFLPKWVQQIEEVLNEQS